MGTTCSAHVKVEKKVPIHAMKAYGGSRDTAPLILNLDTRWRRVVNLTTPMLYPGIHWVGNWVGPKPSRKFFFLQCHHMSSQTSWSPPPLWLKCNRLLSMGRPVGAVTLSRWEWWWNDRWIWGVRGALKLISISYPDHGHHGRLPLSRKNELGRAGNRTRDPMVSSQELWSASHEAGRAESCAEEKNSSPHRDSDRAVPAAEEKKFIQNCSSKIWKDVTDWA